MKKRSAAWLVLIASACFTPALHCAHADETSRFVEDASVLEPTPEAGPGLFEEATAPNPLNVECSEETKQIYVLGTDKTLYRFYPDVLKFVRIGVIGCPSVAGTFSMAIDRRGTAWVEFTDGRLYAVDTTNATCKATAFAPGQSGFSTFGMGFARNGDSANGETLYASGAGLAAIDTKSFALTFLGSLSFGRTELTSMDTQLYAFSVGSGVIVQLDKTTGATQKVYRSSATDADNAFAFAQWGGDFWLFTGSERSQVTQYSPIGDTSKVVVADTGMLIVGAGSSTCAPTKKPN